MTDFSITFRTRARRDNDGFFHRYTIEGYYDYADGYVPDTIQQAMENWLVHGVETEVLEVSHRPKGADPDKWRADDYGRFRAWQRVMRNGDFPKEQDNAK